jgi:hypothetical protein
MPSSDDMINAYNKAVEEAVKRIMKQESCSEHMARKYVDKLTRQEIGEIIGRMPGGAYSTW